MGVIFQEPMSSFSPIHTIGAQIAEVVEVHEDVSRRSRRRAAELLGRVGIPSDGASAALAQVLWRCGGAR